MLTHLESDLVNTDLHHPKILALKTITDHLIMRVKNSKEVIPPYIDLLLVFNNDMFIEFENETIKKYLFDLILTFIFEAF
jgi:hypothetical protein